MANTPNPQGKGLVPVLEGLADCRTRVTVPPKSIDQVSRELFTSLFVLQSRFGFRPVTGRAYWLYRVGEVSRLSLVSPAEWGAGEPFGQPIGECVLQPDLTWTLALTASAAGDPMVQRLIETRRHALTTRLAQVDRLDRALPVYEASLPFQQRALAAGLADSLRRSMQRSGIAELDYRAARALLPIPEA